MKRMNPLLRTDSYKISHHLMYPGKMNNMYDYIESRGGKWDNTVFFGLQMFIKRYLMEPFTQTDINEAEWFYYNHFPAVYKGQIFNKKEFEYILQKYGGYFPVTIKAVSEGSVIPTKNVLVTVECNDPNCPSIVSFLETIMLRDVWYGTTVCTNSYYQKLTFKKFLEETSDSIDSLTTRLHDFGGRGVSSGESAMMGGAAHLVNFLGSDTLEGIEAIRQYYNMRGMPGFSIPATEHSIMASYGKFNEYDICRKMLNKFGVPGGIFAIVNDTYDMKHHVDNIIGEKIFKDKLMKSGATLVTRPDSGEPSESVLYCLNSLAKSYGYKVNGKGYKVLHPSVRVIQGDGIDAKELENVLIKVKDVGFSAENVAFGSGGGLLQKVNRDDAKFAMKCSAIEVDGEFREVFKDPATDSSKKSKKGRLALYKTIGGEYFTLRQDANKYELEPVGAIGVLETVYKNGVLYRNQTFDEIRKNTELWG